MRRGRCVNEAALGTLLIDLFTADEQQVDLQTSQLRFDIPFLANRLVDISIGCASGPNWWVEGRLFGASTGAGAALVAAAKLPGIVQAVVSRGGRPDLAADALERVEAPTLAIVGSNDPVVLELNRQALARMHCVKALEVIAGAGHLFEESEALEQVAKLARAWFS